MPGCVGEATTEWNIRRHFVDRHPNDFVSLPGEGAYLKCELCGMQTSPFAAAHARLHPGVDLIQKPGVNLPWQTGHRLGLICVCAKSDAIEKGSQGVHCFLQMKLIP